MKRLVGLCFLFSFSSLAQDNYCDIYYDNAQRYLQIMEGYDNDKAQITKLKTEYNRSRVAVNKVKNIEKFETCKNLNSQLEKLIYIYK